MPLSKKLIKIFLYGALIACMGFLHAACAPKQADSVLEDAPQSTIDNLTIDSELGMAASKPENLVQSPSLSVSDLEENRSAYGTPFDLEGDTFSPSLPEDEIVPPETDSAQWSITPAPSSTEEERRLAAKNTRDALCAAGETVCITSPYGVHRSSRRHHRGIDIRAPLGSPIMAFRAGVVVRAEYHRSYGYMLEIQQDNGILARYAHMSQLIARKGERVEPGLIIGRVGSTGRSTGPHLHFELLRNNRNINPMAYLSMPKQVVTKGTAADAEAAKKALATSGHSKKSAVKKSSSSKKKNASKTKTSTKKTAAKKSDVKSKSSTKSASAKKTAAKTASAKKTAVKKTDTKAKTGAKSASAKKENTKKQTAKKSEAKAKSSAKNASAKKQSTSSKKSSSKNTANTAKNT